MHPLVRGAAAAAVLTAVGSLEAPPEEDRTASTSALPAMPTSCRPNTIPDGSACIPAPPPGVSGPALAPPTRQRGDGAYDRIPRRPDCPVAYGDYKLPFASPSGKGPRLLEPPAAALELATPRGTPVTLLALEGQQGDAEVVFVGDAFGTTLVTKHELSEGGRTRTYLLVVGRLASVESTAAQGARLAEGALIGHAGDALRLEVRQVQEGATLDHLDADGLRDAALSVPTDPRNVLPLVH